MYIIDKASYDTHRIMAVMNAETDMITSITESWIGRAMILVIM
jgi:hypothetical protein